MPSQIVTQAKPATVRLDSWLTPPQLARRIGWTRQRTLRVLWTLHAQCSHMLMKDVARHDNPTVTPRPRWVVSLAKLQMVAPGLLPIAIGEGPTVGVHVEVPGRRRSAERVGEVAA